MAEARVLPPLTTSEQLELVEHKLGSVGSDLDGISFALEQLSGSSMTVEEYLQMTEEERSARASAAPLDTKQLARLVVFAVDLLGDAERIREYAEKDQGGRALPVPRREREH